MTRKLPKQYLGAFTTVQRDALPSAVLKQADLILNSTLQQYEYWDGTKWVPIGCGFVGGFLEYTMDVSYGTNKTGPTFMHLPEGFHYPAGFNLIDKFYTNGVEAIKGVDWEECPWPIPVSGPWRNMANNFNFVNERARISWGIRLLHGAVNDDDDFRMVWRVRVVPYAPSIRPIAVNGGGQELWNGSKYHDSHSPHNPLGTRPKTNALAIDGRNDFSWLLWRKPRRCNVFGVYEKSPGTGKVKHHMGRGYRPYRIFAPGEYYMPETQPIANYEWKGRFGYKVSYYDTTNGAIGILSAETARRVGTGQTGGGAPDPRISYLID